MDPRTAHTIHTLPTAPRSAWHRPVNLLAVDQGPRRAPLGAPTGRRRRKAR